MTGAIIMIGVIVLGTTLISVVWNERDAESIKGWAIFMLCLSLIGLTVVIVQKGQEQYGIKSTSVPTVTYEVTNTIVDGEVVKSDTLYTVRIKREE